MTQQPLDLETALIIIQVLLGLILGTLIGKSLFERR